MIVVTTPTGTIGRQVLELLLDGGEPVRVIARDPSRLHPEARGRAELVEGSHGDADVVNRAFAGADSVFWVAPPDHHAPSLQAVYLDFARPACAAIERHGVKRVVAVSALGRGVTEKAGLVSASHAMDELIAATGVAFRALALPSFMDNLLRQVEPIRSRGVFFGPLSGHRKHPSCATRDIAAAAARLLLDHSWSGRADVPLLGPEDLSLDDMAAIMSEVLQKPVRFQQIPGDAFKAQLLERGMSEAMAEGTLDMMVAKGKGLDDAEPRTLEATTPTSFRQWCLEVLKPAVLG